MNKGEVNIRVRYKDTDRMGVAYYSNYLVWFEVGRTEFFRNLGVPYAEFESNKIFLPVIKACCEYKFPARYDDELKIVTTVTRLHEIRISFDYEVWRGEEMLARGSTEHAFVNENGRPLILKKSSPFLWRRLQEVLEI